MDLPPHDALYVTLLICHILSAIVGFGAVFFGGVYGSEASKRMGWEGVAIAETMQKVADKFATPFIYLTFVFGFALVFASKGIYRFEDPWVASSIILYIIALGVSHAVHRPNLKKMISLSREMAEKGPPPDGGDASPPPEAVELGKRGKLAALTGAYLNISLVVILVLMVWKPGG